MKEDVAKRWSAALRSGKYVQTKKRLANADRTEHCCMGVLCELAIEDGVELRVASKYVHNELYVHFDGERCMVPRRVRMWSGMRHGFGRIIDAESSLISSLMTMNDDGSTFDEIADVIDKEWERL